MFIALQIDRSRCVDGAGCACCVGVCPVDILRLEAGQLVADAENEDECTLCELCVQACPQGALSIHKRYEG